MNAKFGVKDIISFCLLKLFFNKLMLIVCYVISKL